MARLSSGLEFFFRYDVLPIFLCILSFQIDLSGKIAQPTINYVTRESTPEPLVKFTQPVMSVVSSRQNPSKGFIDPANFITDIPFRSVFSSTTSDNHFVGGVQSVTKEPLVKFTQPVMSVVSSRQNQNKGFIDPANFITDSPFRSLSSSTTSENNYVESVQGVTEDVHHTLEEYETTESVNTQSLNRRNVKAGKLEVTEQSTKTENENIDISVALQSITAKFMHKSSTESSNTHQPHQRQQLVQVCVHTIFSGIYYIFFIQCIFYLPQPEHIILLLINIL